MPKNPMALRVYLAGELFSIKHLLGNAVLGGAIGTRSSGCYDCLIPQDLEQRGTSARDIRDQDIRALLSCDVGVFHYDGTELDSGTVVEFLIAKFADIPSVLLRTDFRHGGDQAGDPWNLMTSFYPRTETVLVDAMTAYKTALGKNGSVKAAEAVHEQIADLVVAALDRVTALPAALPAHLRAPVFEWLSLFPAFGDSTLIPEIKAMLDQKIRRGLL